MNYSNRGFAWAFVALTTCLLINGCLKPALAESINLDHIAKIESSDRNYIRNGNSFGKFQITPQALKDFKQVTGSRIRHCELLGNEEKSAQIALFMFDERIPQILKSKNIPVTKANILSAYNCGYSPKCFDSKRRPTETKNYISKYRKLNGGKL